MNVYLTTPLIWGLSGLDFIVLFVIGVVICSTIWILVEVTKKRVPAIIETELVEALPYIFGGLLTGIFFPPALEGVEPDHTVPLKVIWAGVVVFTFVSGKGAKFAHDKVRFLMCAMFDGVTSFFARIGE